MKFVNLIKVTQIGIFIVGMLPFVAFAAPSVNSVNGSISNGQLITINGTGFGANGPTVVYFDDFEKGTNGSIINVGSSTAQIGGYSYVDPYAKYSNTYKNGGNLAFFSDVSQGTNSAQIPLPVGTKEVFYSYNNYVPSNSPLPGENSGGINWKMIWELGALGNSGTATSPTFFHVMNAINTIHLGANDPDASTAVDVYEGSTFVKGAWNFYSVWHKLGTNNNGGIFITFKNQNSRGTAGSNTANITSSSTTNDIRNINLNGYVRQTPGASVYFDDVYVATGPYARARVEIGDASSYANCSKIAIATAVTWADSQVTAIIRQGSFNTGDNAYLYLIDANGNVSNGQQITFGGGVTGGTVSLPSPSNLKVTAQ